MTDAKAPSTASARYPARRILILLAAFAAPLIGYGQMALDLGMSPSDFSAQGDSTLRVAGFAFAIWGVIYAWLLAYAVYQALPSTREGELTRALGWPSFFTLAGTGLWVVASAADWEWGTVAIIVASKLCLVSALYGLGTRWLSEPRRRQALVVWPLGLLAGWLSIAALVNILTVATSQGLIAPDTANLWALGAVGIVAVQAIVVTSRTRIWTYPVPMAWGLVGAFFAQRADGDDILALSAAGAAVLIGVAAILILSRKATSQG